ncbi:hypothetical protein FSP39_022204 [Pinctada imbricata]|uniref:receptor protein-tyrosine kinase n=1 Tax=Pinctada imbricata TaxID=66713 RepID=A0AA88XJ90_PINIB|nr:hypothetical protein FSP39_022204 [Pinctada imbricata]
MERLIACTCLVIFLQLYLVQTSSIPVQSASTPKCFTNRSDVVHKRQFYYNGKSLTIMLEGSRRVSQNITNYVLKILLLEVVGYSRVEIHEELQDSLNTTAILDRLAGCGATECVGESVRPVVPKSMVSIEVPVLPGLDLSRWRSSGRVTDAGFLGPRGRLGWFISSETTRQFWVDQNIIVDHWQSLFLPEVAYTFAMSDQLSLITNLTLKDANSGKHFCDTDECNQGIYYSPSCVFNNVTCALLLSSYPEVDNGALKTLIKNLNLPVNVAWIGDHLTHFVLEHAQKGLPVMFFGLHPEVVTSAHNFTRVQFPTCQEAYEYFPKNCDYEMTQFSKFVWNKVKTNALEAYYVISRLHFDQSTYQLLLRNHAVKHSAFEVACDWLIHNEAMWKSWIPENLAVKPKIYLLGFFPLSGPGWIEPGLKEGAELALEVVNQENSTLSEHDLDIIYIDSQCKADVAMREFIKYIQTNNSSPIAGVLGPACSDEAEPIAALSKHFNILTISYGAEAASLSDRVTYPYFYRTIPQVESHKYVYETFFKVMKWNKVGTLAEAGHEFPDYHLALQDYLKTKGITIVIKRNIKASAKVPDITQIFEDLRNQKVKIIIADLFVPAARAIMCQAYRQRMTAHEGYVWFLPSWYSNNWWDVDLHNKQTQNKEDMIPCTTPMMKYAIDGHFMLSKTLYESPKTLVIGNITIGQFKVRYAKKVGQQGGSGSPFAGFVYDAVWVYALALDKLLRTNPGAVEKLHSKESTKALMNYIEKTRFKGLSGDVSFRGSDRPGAINILQFFLNGTRVVGRYDPKVPVADGGLEIIQNKIKWLTRNGSPPTDGEIEEEECVIEEFRKAFNVSCVMAIVIANLLGFIIFIAIVIGILIFIKVRYDSKMRNTHERMKELGLLSSDFTHCLSLDEWEMPRDKVVLNRVLGEGAFGKVYGGEAYLDNECWVAVAVKTLKVGSRVEEKIDFLSEAEIMKRFNHSNIVQLLGVCTRGEPVYAVMEFHLHGDLKTYLLSRRNLVGLDLKEAEEVSPGRLTQMARDVASGLRYIHDLRYVHRDLACRNCMVHANGMVKIGDFGMTRPVIESDYYRFTKKGMLPVRWMSPESLWDGLFTAKSDIWSYGVLVFEIVTFGSFPYQGLSNSQVLEYVKKGSKLILPANCPEELCNFIYSCLAYEANDRPDIEDIIDQLLKNPEFLRPCLDAPTTSVVIEDNGSMELLTTSGQNTLTKSHSLNLATLLNRLSQTSQDTKRLSGGSMGVAKITTPTKCVKTFIPPIFNRPRSNSIGTPQENHKQRMEEYQEFHMDSPSGSLLNQSNRHSHEIPSEFTFPNGIPMAALNTPGSERADATSDYFSDNSKEICQNLTFEFCQTITSL